MIEIKNKRELKYWTNRLEYAESLLESTSTKLSMIHHVKDNIDYADEMLRRLRLRYLDID